MIERRPSIDPVHPGEILREDVLPALAMSKTAVADALRVSRHTLRAILDERRPVTAEMAVSGSACNAATIWRSRNAESTFRGYRPSTPRRPSAPARARPRPRRDAAGLGNSRFSNGLARSRRPAGAFPAAFLVRDGPGRSGLSAVAGAARHPVSHHAGRPLPGSAGVPPAWCETRSGTRHPGRHRRGRGSGSGLAGETRLGGAARGRYSAGPACEDGGAVRRMSSVRAAIDSVCRSFSASARRWSASARCRSAFARRQF